jgi:hypothetical protein
MKLREIAHARAGDKGNIVNISAIVFRDSDYALLVEQVTAERVRELFASLIVGPVDRYLIPGLGAVNFVLRRPESESVTRSLRLDAHGKGLSYLLLNLEIDKEIDEEIDEE